MTTVEIDGNTVALSAAEVNKLADTSQWFEQEVVVPPQFTELLVKYAGLAPDQVKQHVTDVRKRAFDAWPYPCIGQLRFMELTTSRHPSYAAVLDRLKAGQTYVDVGCCVGQDLRKLLYDGAPSSANMAGIDVEPAFFDLGKELFRDGGATSSGPNSFQGAFFAADLTKPDALPADLLANLAGKTDIIGIQSVFHLFGLKNQKLLAHSLLKILRPQKGALIIGRQLGAEPAGAVIGLDAAKAYAHNPETWQAFWEELGRETGTEWRLECQVGQLPDKTKNQKWAHESLNFLFWSVERV